jgi:H/ACA ribonucleoprotein complex subunit 4
VNLISKNKKNLKDPYSKERKIYALSKTTKVKNYSEIINYRERTVDELIKTGVVNLNKPMGPTSHQVSSWVKNIFGSDRVGHGGTLDPRVTGVLPLAFGKTTKLLKLLSTAPKKYVGVMRLHGDLPKSEIQRISEQFTGPIYQIPPVRSAVKRQLRVRTVYSLDILEQKKRDVLFQVHCEAGTYIRSLVHDIGLVLTTGAHMQELRRVRSGPFFESDSVTLHDLKDAWVFWTEEKNDELLRRYIKPMEILLNDLPKVIIHDSAVDAICHGADLAVPGIVQFDDIIKKGEPIAILTRKGEGVALGEGEMLTKEILEKSSGISVKTIRVLMDPGTYNKGWKKKLD